MEEQPKVARPITLLDEVIEGGLSYAPAVCFWCAFALVIATIGVAFGWRTVLSMLLLAAVLVLCVVGWRRVRRVARGREPFYRTIDKEAKEELRRRSGSAR